MVKLYHFPLSAPSRGALLSARLIGVALDIEIINLFQKEQFNDEFLKINPQHCLPTLDDEGFILWESRAISCYLSDQHGFNDKFYPKDVKKRALVNQRLFFDSSSLYVKIRAICYPILFEGKKDITQTQKDELNQALVILENYLSTTKWVAGDTPTIADTSIYASISSILAVGWDISKFPKIEKWVSRCKKLPGAIENDDGARAFGDAVKHNMKHTHTHIHTHKK